MRKLPAVEAARAIMTEAQNWSMWRWLTEKRKVREAADRATDALNEAEAKVKAGWSDELREAYEALVAEEANGGAKSGRRPGKKSTREIDPEIKAIAKKVKDADDEAERVRLDAEDIFAEAERRMSTSMARDGARRALERYDLHESAIRKAESAAKASSSAA